MADTVEFHNISVTRETSVGEPNEGALLCEIGGEEIWMPKSQISDDSEVYDGDMNSEGTLIVTRWIAEQKNLL